MKARLVASRGWHALHVLRSSFAPERFRLPPAVHVLGLKKVVSGGPPRTIASDQASIGLPDSISLN
jgi:hypothetical protein